MSAAALSRPSWLPDRDRAVWLLNRCFVQGSIALIPYDLPLVHQACVPLAALAVLLMILRDDLAAFADFLRSLAVLWLISLLVCGVALFSIFANMTPILESVFQGELGWTRALLQGALLLVTALYPFYLAFCLRRYGEGWVAIVTQAAWWSLPFPFLIGFLQIANLLHVPGVAHLPFVGGAYEGGFWRLTSVARESSWFGSFSCVILPFVIMDTSRLAGWRHWAGMGAIGIMLFFVLLGTSKSAYAALAAEGAVAAVLWLLIRRPWRFLGKALLALLLLFTSLLLTAIFAPGVFDKIAAPVIRRAVTLYQLFEPLLLGNTHFLSIGTRFGMSAAGTGMGEDFPLAGVGLGQFGFHAYNYTPVWGLNSETVAWISNDVKGWPSTSNLYTRLYAEIGLLGVSAYVALRAALLAAVGLRLSRRSNSHWGRDLGIFSAMAALIAFDFHRDSFINLDIWSVMAMAMASLPAAKAAHVRHREMARARVTHFLFPAAAFCLGLGLLLSQPASHLASATIIGNQDQVIASSGDGAGSQEPSVAIMPGKERRFDLFRLYWGSANVAAGIIHARPDLARAVLAGAPVTPSLLSRYIHDHVTVLMADKQSTLTLQYRNADPGVARDFLSVAIAQTDRAIVDGSAAQNDQAGAIPGLIQSADFQVRQVLLARAAAQNLQRSFDAAGNHPSFTFVEHPGLLPEEQSPQPAAALLFALGLAVLAAAMFETACLPLRFRAAAT